MLCLVKLHSMYINICTMYNEVMEFWVKMYNKTCTTKVFLQVLYRYGYAKASISKAFQRNWVCTGQDAMNDYASALFSIQGIWKISVPCKPVGYMAGQAGEFLIIRTKQLVFGNLPFLLIGDEFAVF